MRWNCLVALIWQRRCAYTHMHRRMCECMWPSDLIAVTTYEHDLNETVSVQTGENDIEIRRDEKWKIERAIRTIYNYRVQLVWCAYEMFNKISRLASMMKPNWFCMPASMSPNHTHESRKSSTEYWLSQCCHSRH